MSTKSFFLRRAIIGIAITCYAATLIACKSRPNTSSAKTQNKSTLGDLEEYEAVNCPKTLCTADTSVVGINPQDSDLVALGISSHSEQMALQDPAMVDDVKGLEAEKRLDESRIAHETLTRALTGESSRKSENVAGTGMTALFGSLSGAIASGAKITAFTKNNIEAENDEQRAKTLKKIVSLVTETKKLLKPEDKDKLSSVLPALKILAGDDGWINRGDLPRFLPVIPNVVGQIADEKINQGYAEGIAELARSKPLAYRRWVKAPNGIIGRVVQKNVNQQLNAAYSQKWVAIEGASARFQQSFTSMMDTIGAERFYLNVDDGKNYYDPAATIEEKEIDTIAKAVVGKPLRDIVRAAAENQGTVQTGSLDLGPAAILLQSVVLPEGVPIAEIDTLIRESQGFTKEVLPKNLSFRLTSDGRLEIKRLAKK